LLASVAYKCDTLMGMECEEITASDYEVTTKPKEKRKSVDKNSSKSDRKSSSRSDTPKARKTNFKESPSKMPDYDKITFLGMTNNIDTPVMKREDLPYKCDECKTSFDNDIDLQRHMKSHSIKTMAYMCQYCGRGFATHSNRKEHERIHTGDKPYVCPSELPLGAYDLNFQVTRLQGLNLI